MLDSKSILIAAGAAAIAIAINWIVIKLLGLRSKQAAEAEGHLIVEKAEQEA